MVDALNGNSDMVQVLSTGGDVVMCTEYTYSVLLNLHIKSHAQ